MKGSQEGGVAVRALREKHDFVKELTKEKDIATLTRFEKVRCMAYLLEKLWAIEESLKEKILSLKDEVVAVSAHYFKRARRQSFIHDWI